MSTFAQEFNFENIFNLPSEIINTIFNDGYSANYLLRLRLVNKTILDRIENFCMNQCKNILHQGISDLQLYYNIKIHNIITPPKEIFYSQTLTCSNCLYDSGFLVSSDQVKYKCAFGCRSYYCSNRNCENLFGKIFQIRDLNDLTCDECKIELEPHCRGIDPYICNQYECGGSIHSSCIQDDGLAIHACNSCIEEQEGYGCS